MNYLFITREGYAQPGARIRCYGFSSELKKRKVQADVFSFVDTLGAKAGKNETNFSLREKLLYIKKGFAELHRKKDCIFIINRLNYHSIPSFIVSKLNRMPFIFDMDDWEARERIGYYFKLFPRSKAEYLTRLFARQSVLCLTASTYLKEYLSKVNKTVHFIPTGIDTEKFKYIPHERDKDFIFSWHGSVNRKEILGYIIFLLDCFSVLKKKYGFIKFQITGDGIYGDELRGIVKKRDFPGVDYKGWISPDDIPGHLACVDAGLIALLDKTIFNLSKCPVKLLEYMALGKPTIASPIGEAESIIEHGHSGFLASNKAEFLHYMEILIRNPQKARLVGQNASNIIKEKYSLEVLGERLYTILKDNLP